MTILEKGDVKISRYIFFFTELYSEKHQARLKIEDIIDTNWIVSMDVKWKSKSKFHVEKSNLTDSYKRSAILTALGNMMYPWTIGSKVASMLTSTNSPLDATKSLRRLACLSLVMYSGPWKPEPWGGRPRKFDPRTRPDPEKQNPNHPRRQPILNFTLKIPETPRRTSPKCWSPNPTSKSRPGIHHYL